MTVELNGVRLRFGSIEALAGVDLRVDPGERVALIGPSGAGKSSLLDVIGGLSPPTEGTVRVLDTDLGRGIGALPRRQRRRHGRRVGTVSQRHDLVLSLRVVHNVNAGLLGDWSTARALASLIAPSGRDRVAATLDLVGLAHRIDARTGDLSGGERQRVAVARVLRQDPDLLLADEPTSSVDPTLSDLVMGLLCRPRSEAESTTIVTVHDPALALRHATRVVGLRSGRVVLDRPAAEVTDADLDAVYAASTSPPTSGPTSGATSANSSDSSSAPSS